MTICFDWPMPSLENGKSGGKYSVIVLALWNLHLRTFFFSSVRGSIGSGC